MKFTKKIPEKDGLYWARCSDKYRVKDRFADPLIVRLKTYENHKSAIDIQRHAYADADLYVYGNRIHEPKRIIDID